MSDQPFTPVRGRPRSGVGVEIQALAPEGTYDVRRDGRAWLYGVDWEEITRAMRGISIDTQVQFIDTTGYRQMIRVQR